VEVSTTFDSDKLKVVIDKLKEIYESIVASKDTDATNELASKAKYDLLKDEIDKLRTSKFALLAYKKGAKIGN
jgi:hypothetical protein